MNNWYYKWKAFFFPVPGWKARYAQFKGGNMMWKVPGRDDKPPLGPFPLEWIPHSLIEADFTEEDHVRGFSMPSPLCVDSGLVASPENSGALCLRCGVPLHFSAAHQFSIMDPPSCYRCSWILLIYK